MIIYQLLLLYFDVFTEVKMAVSHINMVIHSKNVSKGLWKGQQHMFLLQATDDWCQQQFPPQVNAA